MKNTDHFNIPYPETTDPVSQFPDQVAKSTAELIDTFLYEQEQKQTAIDEALDGKAPVSHTHSTSQVNGLDEALQGKAPVSHTHSTSQVNGLDEALQGKAPVSHTHSTSQVNGLDTALDGKAAQATLNTRVPAGLALRIDTTVGTRIFAGNTMIYGDTGRRSLVSWDADGNIVGNMPSGLEPLPGTSGYIVIRREANLVTMYIKGARATTTVFAVQGLVPGFTADTSTWELAYARAGTNSLAKQVLVRLGSGHATFSGIEVGNQFGDSQYHVTIRWTPSDTWPTSLPGTPA